MSTVYKRYQTLKCCAVEADHVLHMAVEQMARTCLYTRKKYALWGKKHKTTISLYLGSFRT